MVGQFANIIHAGEIPSRFHIIRKADHLIKRRHADTPRRMVTDGVKHIGIRYAIFVLCYERAYLSMPKLFVVTGDSSDSACSTII